MSYPDSVQYLYSLGNELKAGAKFGLEKMQALLAALGHPEKNQRFVHVAGTNGKGSTCAMIASILQACGLRTGLYTSPHLIEPTERIKIDGRDIDEKQFAANFHIVHEAAERLLSEGQIDAHPSYFETVTAMALLFFRERSDVAVIEVGLGGRLDATNVITPELCVIAPISYDHEAFLGNSLESIATEKSGIIKAQVPIVIGRQHREAEQVVLRRAGELSCKIVRVTDADFELMRINSAGSDFRFEEKEYHCPLPGRHQVDNAVASLLACQQLNIPEQSWAEGLRQVQWPGRLEQIASRPDFFLDGAHNPAGAAALSEYIREFCFGRPIWLVYGAMRDKAIGEVTEQLFPLATRLIVTMPDFPRALRPEAILEVTGHPNAVLAHTLIEAIEVARTAPSEAAVFFTGSLYLVGEVRKLLLRTRTMLS